MTGDDTIVYFHVRCGWRDEPQRPKIFMVNECPQCRDRNVLSYVTYKAGAEEEAADELIRRRMRA